MAFPTCIMDYSVHLPGVPDTLSIASSAKRYVQRTTCRPVYRAREREVHREPFAQMRSGPARDRAEGVAAMWSWIVQGGLKGPEKPMDFMHGGGAAAVEGKMHVWVQGTSR
jgi:uncharacterized membrane protein